MPYPPKTSPDAIRNAALALLQAEGPDALTLRRVAAAIGVVPNALYRHFPSRDALVAAVADHVARTVLEILRTAAAAQTAPEERLRAVANAYTAFAAAQPALYAMIIVSTADGESALAQPLGKDLLWALVVDEVAPLVGADDAQRAAVALWALLHGLIDLRRSRLMGGRRPDDVGTYPLDALLRGFARTG